YP
ncbi:hypothetical protein ECEC1869_3591, partial [Escherichia coli EC1869]